MAVYQNRLWRVERPHTATFLLMTANILVFGLCLHNSNGAAISPDVLYRNGAMYALAIDRHEYWRLIAYGFLHANLFHIATNMICLVLWGGILEKRIGAFYFLVIYFCAMTVGAIVSNSYHAGPYLMVGASGAVSGILGVLLCLWILGKVDLSAGFFAINIGLNLAVTVGSSSVDWVDHFGGFAAGLIACALIDILERVNRFAFRCKFPEFVKINSLILGVTLGILLWRTRPGVPTLGDPEGWFLLLIYSAACLAAIKLVDLVMSLKKGLAIIVVAFAVANAGLVLVAGRMLDSVLGANCASPPPGAGGLTETLAHVVCVNWPMTVAITTACSFAVTILLYSQELVRGVKDVGFVGASLRAERKRRQGI
jgi:membrane associated rhomboid family serine protease